MGPSALVRRGRRAAEKLMVDTCTVTRLTGGWVEGPDGVEVREEQAVYEGRCKVSSFDPQTNESVSVGSPTNESRYTVHFPAGTQVLDGDKVLVEGREKPLYLRGSHDITWQTAVRMQAEEVSNA
jgi:hypothetical protein